MGFNLSALYKRDALSAGLSFRSGSTLSLGGNYTPQNQILVAANSTLKSVGRRGLEPAQTASVDFDLPWRLALGVRYEINDDLAVELDYNRTGWSDFETLKVEGDDNGAVIFSDVNDWQDANAYRLGVTYQVRPETQLRLGYAYDETGQPDAHFSARVPDNDRQLFSIGLAQTLGDGYSIEGAYCYVLANDRDFRSDTPYTGGDVNGTSALDGEYSLNAHTLAIQLVKTF
jgi:long-chain fatty acid transport protein